MFRLPDLPTASTRGYSSTPVQLQPASNGNHNPAFGSAGLVLTALGCWLYSSWLPLRAVS